MEVPPLSLPLRLLLQPPWLTTGRARFRAAVPGCDPLFAALRPAPTNWATCTTSSLRRTFSTSWPGGRKKPATLSLSLDIRRPRPSPNDLSASNATACRAPKIEPVCDCQAASEWGAKAERERNRRQWRSRTMAHQVSHCPGRRGNGEEAAPQLRSYKICLELKPNAHQCPKPREGQLLQLLIDSR